MLDVLDIRGPRAGIWIARPSDDEAPVRQFARGLDQELCNVGCLSPL